MNSRNQKFNLLNSSILAMCFLVANTHAQLLPGESLPVLENIEVNVVVQLSTNGIFTYSYSITNPASNTGHIIDIKVDISRSTAAVELGSEGLTNDESFLTEISRLILNRKGPQLVSVGFRSPPGWMSGVSIDLTARWGSSDPQGNGSFFINPGQTRSGFIIQSRGIPGVRSITLKPRFEPTPVDDAGPEDLARILAINAQIERSAQTIGPIAPISLEPDSLADDLISLKEGLLASGGIFGPGAKGIVTSLDAKLDAAKKSIAKGKNKTAKNQLNAFINELEAQRDKHLTDNAFFLLKVNAEFIISKLGT